MSAVEGSSSSEGEARDAEMRDLVWSWLRTPEAARIAIRFNWGDATSLGVYLAAARQPSSAADAKPVAWEIVSYDTYPGAVWISPDKADEYRAKYGCVLRALYAQPHPSQQAGAEGEREKLIGLQIEAHPMDKHYAVMCEITPDGADAILAALKPVEG